MCIDKKMQWYFLHKGIMYRTKTALRFPPLSEVALMSKVVFFYIHDVMKFLMHVHRLIPLVPLHQMIKIRVDTLSYEQYGQHFTDDIVICIFNEKHRILIHILLKIFS